jgi:hypothetical protein
LCLFFLQIRNQMVVCANFQRVPSALINAGS